MLGEIPESLGQLTKLFSLILHQNQLSGKIERLFVYAVDRLRSPNDYLFVRFTLVRAIALFVVYFPFILAGGV